MSIRIRQLNSVEEVRRLDGLLGDYIRFVTESWVRDFGVTFDPETLLTNSLSSLDKVVPPKGMTFVAEDAEATPLGMAFLRPSGPDAMEIKRLFVTPAGRGRGTGKALVETAIETARRTGATRLRLDTTRNLGAAIALYQGYGFEDCDPYPESDHYEDPILGPYMLFMEKRL